jgi:hypothetical protein
MGVPDILRVRGRFLELLEGLLEHLVVLEHTPALIVVASGLPFFHAGILPFVTPVQVTNVGQWGKEQE